MRTPADSCADKDTLLEPTVRTVIDIAGVEQQKGEFNILGATEPELKYSPEAGNDG